MTTLDFELNKLWVDGTVGFDLAPDVVVLRGDLVLKVDAKEVPGLRAPGQEPVINDWLLDLHKLMRPRHADVEFDPRPLVPERIRLIRKGEQSILRVTKGRRPVVGFEGITLEHAQVVEMVGRFELRVKELLLGLATADQAAKWWRGKTIDSIDQAGIWQGKKK